MCPLILGVNTTVQEGLVGLQLAYVRSYSLRDALAAQGPILAGNVLGSLGGAAAYYSRLGALGKALLGTAVGAPQILFDGLMTGSASADGISC